MNEKQIQKEEKKKKKQIMRSIPQSLQQEQALENRTLPGQ
jgi:hypothetical protein